MGVLIELVVVCLVTCAMLWTLVVGLDKQVQIEQQYVTEYAHRGH